MFRRMLAVAAIGATVAFVAKVSDARAADHAAVQNFLSDDVAAVGYVDLTRLDLPAATEQFISLGLGPPPNQEAELRQQVAQAQTEIAELVSRGVRRVYVLFRVSDFAAGGTTWIIELTKDADAKAAGELVRSKIAEAPGGLQDVLPSKFVAVGNLLLGASSDERLQRLAGSASAKLRDDAAEVLAAFGEANAGVVVMGDGDSRRVIREMFPQAPPPFTEIDGRLLADGIRQAAVTIKLPPAAALTLSIDASDAKTAALLSDSCTKALELAKAFELAELAAGPPAHKARASGLLPLFPMLKPKVDDTHVSLTLEGKEQELAAVSKALGPTMNSARERATRVERMNQFKQIAVAMFMYADKHNTFPPAAVYDAAGKPLLSWRVALLPFLGQEKLYSEFRLDEPWDGERNQRLIARMPDIFADPDPSTRHALGDAGLTTYQVPRGDVTAFPGHEGTRQSDIKDGSAQTILLVEVNSDRAVAWTKPDDWEVDLKDPLKGVKRSDRPMSIAFCDGHIESVPSDIDPAEFAKLLTRAGGETPKR